MPAQPGKHVEQSRGLADGQKTTSRREDEEGRRRKEKKRVKKCEKEIDRSAFSEEEQEEREG